MKVTKIDASFVRSLILPRKKDSHKGDYGHVLVVAGSGNMAGAAVLCVNAALRTGAGLVTAAVPKSLLPAVSKRIMPEAMTLPLSESRGGELSAAAYEQISAFIKNRKVSVLAVGPGLGAGRAAGALVKKLIFNAGIPVVLDADGLNAIKAVDLKRSGARIIITPHPGEMSKLTGIKTADIAKNRSLVARRFAKDINVVCVLKGSGTVVTDGRKTYVNSTGNPGMAKGGSGDVLCGMIAALTAQVKQPGLLSAALAGVFVHGLAGDIAAKEKTVISALPQDIITNIAGAFRRII